MNKLTGNVWLDGNISYSGITPRFNSHGLDVYRLRENGEGIALIETQGPHFFFQLPSLLLMSIPPEALAKGAKYSFTGPGIGSIRMLYGYASADLGSHMRIVDQYCLFVTIESSTLSFCITGRAGPMTDIRPNEKYPDSQEFRIEFSLPAGLYGVVVENKNAQEALQRLMSAASHA